VPKCATYNQLTERTEQNEKLFKTQLAELYKKLDTMDERWGLGEISREVYEKFAPQ